MTRVRLQRVTVTKYRTRTVTVPPKLPGGAVLPSKRPARTLTRFTLPGRRVSCTIGGGSVRCDVTGPRFSPPPEPASCTQSWGTGVVLTQSRSAVRAQFACGGAPARSQGVPVLEIGDDDTVGPITCEARRFGVDCFAQDRRGFILAPTGYMRY